MSTESRPDRWLLEPRSSPVLIVVVEPHADDAMLSLGTSIRRWITVGHEVTVVTVFWPDEERAREGQAWARDIGAKWRGLGQPNRSPQGAGPLPNPVLPADLRGDETVRIWPLGFGHPDHRAVGDRAEPHGLRYVDTPYQQLAALHEETLKAVRNMTIVWWCPPDERKWDDAVCFPSQAGLFRMFEAELRSSPEIVLRDEGDRGGVLNAVRSRMTRGARRRRRMSR